MKILMVIPYLASVYGGTTKIVKELANSLGHQGIDVDIITTNANSNSHLSFKTDHWVNEKNYRVQYFQSWHRGDFILSLELTRWLLNNIGNYHLVHTHTVFAPIISLTHIICRIKKVSYIATPHGMLEPWALAYKSTKKKIYYALLEKVFLKQADAVQITATPESINVNKLNLCRQILVPNGLHCSRYKSLTEPRIFQEYFPGLKEKKLILFLGRIDPKKGLNFLASAFAKVHAVFPNTHLVLAGPDSINFTPTVQSYFTEANCLDAVTFTGMLSGDLKYSALAAADLYVSPSYSEGFSMSVLEGMASGLPCVITTGCNFPEAAINHAAHVVDIDANAIANALLQCLSNPQEAKDMGDRARQFIFENYTWDKAAQKLIFEYEKIIKGESSQPPIR